MYRLAIGVLGLCAIASLPAHAVTTSQVYGSSLTKQTHTFFLQGETGWSTYDSELAGSQASAGSYGLKVGGYAGENRVLGVFLDARDHTVDFPLNRSGMYMAQRDLHMQVRMGWFYASAIVNQTQVQVDLEEVNSADAVVFGTPPRNEEVFADIYGNNAGAAVGVHAPLTSNIVIHGDVAQYQAISAAEKNGKDVSFGTRSDVDVGASLDLTKTMIDIVMGYRYSTSSFTIDSQTYSDKITTPYAGMRLGIYF